MTIYYAYRLSFIESQEIRRNPIFWKIGFLKWAKRPTIRSPNFSLAVPS